MSGCMTCTHRCTDDGFEGPDGRLLGLCDHPSLYDLDVAEAGQRHPDATDEVLAEGRRIRAWLDGLADYAVDGCPGREVTP